MPDILHLLKVDAPPERVYEALTTAQGVRNWWTRDADLEHAIGGKGEFRFPSYGGECHITRVEVIEVTPPRRVGWKTTFSFRPEWNGTTIHFDIQRERGATMLHFAHRGFNEADDVFALCNTGWAYYLVSLQQYLQTGRGAPSPQIDFPHILRQTQGALVDS